MQNHMNSQNDTQEKQIHKRLPMIPILGMISHSSRMLGLHGPEFMVPEGHELCM